MVRNSLDYVRIQTTSALNLPTGPVTSYEQLHGNWIKSADCKFAEVPGFGDRKTVECICQKTQE